MGVQISPIQPIFLLAFLVGCPQPANDDTGSTDAEVDSDGDGLPDWLEAEVGTDPNNTDTDGDGLTDANEVYGSTDPTDDDTDDDGLTDGEEDSDGDGAVDVGETDATEADTDGDGINDGDEFDAGTDPLDVDSDDDGLTDGDELDANTLPLVFDTDDDGISDFAEWIIWGTDPTDPDTDGDGVEDGEELLDGTDPLQADTDGDGVDDGDEATDGTDPLDADTDGDGVVDGDESTAGTDPLLPDTDADGLTDGEEAGLGTDPLDDDSDGDGALDGDEVAAGTDPLVSDGTGPGPVPDHIVCATAGDFTSIQAAIDAAVDGDVIQVCAGLYRERLFIEDKSVTLYAPDGPENTTVDAELTGRAITIRNATTGTGIIGFTVRQGVSTERGGGIFAEQSKVHIENVHVRECLADLGGAGVNIDGGESFITELDISDLGSVSPYPEPPVLRVRGSSLILQQSRFANNTLDRGAVIVYTGLPGNPSPAGPPVIRNILIDGNSTRASSNTCDRYVNVYGDEGTVHNAVIVNNTCRGGTADAVIRAPSIHSSVIMMNTAFSGYEQNDIEYAEHNWVSGQTKCSFGPHSAHLGSECWAPWPNEHWAAVQFVDLAGSDYHLVSTSPGVDGGRDDASFLDPDGTRADVGVYGGPWAWED